MRCLHRQALCVTVLLSISVSAWTAESIFIRGDSNADARVDIADPIFTLAYSFLGSNAPACADAADANDDGSIDISDSVFTLFFLFQGSTKTPPAPFPAAGLDATADSLHCDADVVGGGTLLLAIHDTPPADLTEFWITIQEVQVTQANGTELQVFPPAGDPTAEKAVNLLDNASASSIIASISVPAGDYSEVEIRFDHANAKAGAAEVLVVPDHGDVEIHLQTPITVTDGTLSALVLDFNLIASLTDGGEGKVFLNPVIEKDDDGNDDGEDGDVELKEFHGTVASVDVASNSFVVNLSVHKRRGEETVIAGQVTVVVDEKTTYEDTDGLAALQEGQEVEVKGDLREDGTVLASKVELKSDDEGEDLDDDGVEDEDEHNGHDSDIDNDGQPNHEDEDDDNDGVSDDDDSDDDNDGINDDSDEDHVDDGVDDHHDGDGHHDDGDGEDDEAGEGDDPPGDDDTTNDDSAAP